MGTNKKSPDKSRRQFFSFLFPVSGEATNHEKVKMLTPDGKLVEVDKSVVEAALTNKKASNKEIYDWMKNPSKVNS